MVKYMLAVFAAPAHACVGMVVGFSGLNNQFDHQAFYDYHNRYGWCGRVFSHNQATEAIDFIGALKTPYQLYGFSKGAETVGIVLAGTKTKPVYVVTIGAHRTARVDFSAYGVRYQNYFDLSGRGNPAPGIHLVATPHYLMQSTVNRLTK